MAVLLFIPAFVLPTLVNAGLPRSASAWASIREKDWENFEAQHESGDDRAELRTEGDETYAAMERKKEELMAVGPTAEQLADPQAYAAAHRRVQAGPTMMFVVFNMTRKAGGTMTTDDTDEIAYRWQRLLWTGGLEVNCYDGGLPDGSRMMVTMQKGWRAEELKDFLLKQPEVRMVEWEHAKYWPDGAPKALPAPPRTPTTAKQEPSHGNAGGQRLKQGKKKNRRRKKKNKRKKRKKKRAEKKK